MEATNQSDTVTMASKEPFLPVPTEEDPENGMAAIHAVPTMATYSPTGPGSASFAEPMSVEASTAEGFPNASNYHTICCNCCCDFRRAVLIVNGITIGLKLLIMMGFAILVSYVGKNLDDIEEDMNDDEFRKSFDSFFKSGSVAGLEAFVEVLETISVGLHACGIYGALNFKQWGIITAGTMYALSLLLGLFSMDIGNIVVSGLCLYPHICMYNLMKAGIMTPYNYHKVATCCGDRHL